MFLLYAVKEVTFLWRLVVNGLRSNKKPAVRRVLFVNGGADEIRTRGLCLDRAAC